MAIVHIVATEEDGRALRERRPGAQIHVLGGLLNVTGDLGLDLLDLNVPPAEGYDLYSLVARRQDRRRLDPIATTSYLLNFVLDRTKIVGYPGDEVVEVQVREVMAYAARLPTQRTGPDA